MAKLQAQLGGLRWGEAPIAPVAICRWIALTHADRQRLERRWGRRLFGAASVAGAPIQRPLIGAAGNISSASATRANRRNSSMRRWARRGGLPLKRNRAHAGVISPAGDRINSS